jgi:hypothetical protein
LELLDEVEHLSEPYKPMRYKGGLFCDNHAWPYSGEYYGVRCGDVPDQYLWEWESKFDRESLQLDYGFSNFKTKWLTNRKLMLFEYVKERLSRAVSELSEA